MAGRRELGRGRWLARIAAALLAAGAGLGIGAAPAAAQTLRDTLVMTYQNSPTLQAQRAHLRAQDEEVSQALAGWRPTVTVNSSAGRQLNDNKSSKLTPSTAYWTTPTGAQITVNQPIYSGGKTTAQTKQSEHLVQVERSRLNLVEEQVLLQAATAYIDVVRDQAVLRLNVNNERVLEQQLEATRDEFRVGEVTRTDVSQAEARLEGAKAGRLAALNQLQISRAGFRNVVGVLPGRLIDPGEPPGLPATRDDAMTLAQTQNPNVKIADYTLSAARDNVNVVFAGLMPQLSIQGQLSSAQEQFVRNDFYDYASIQAVLSIPLYTRGLVDGQVREAKQIVGQREFELQQSLRQATQDATTAWENLQSARAQEVAFKATIAADTVALEGVKEEATAGLRTILDILNAEQELLTAQVSLVTSHHDAIVAGYTLLSATGQLTAADRQLPVEYYDPTKHYFEVRDQWVGTSDRH